MKSSPVCERCGVTLVLARTGRPKRFCGTTCRVAACRARPRQLELPVPVPVPAVPWRAVD